RHADGHQDLKRSELASKNRKSSPQERGSDHEHPEEASQKKSDKNADADDDAKGHWRVVFGADIPAQEKCDYYRHGPNQKDRKLSNTCRAKHDVVISTL